MVSEQLTFSDPDGPQEITIPMADFLNLIQSLETQGRTILAWDCDWKRHTYTVHHIGRGKVGKTRFGEKAP